MRLVAAVIALVASTVAATANAQQPERPAFTGRLSLEIADAINNDEFETLVQWLQLTEEQEIWAEQLLEAHLAQDAEMRARELEKVRALADGLPSPYEPMDIEAYSAVRKQSVELGRSLGLLEDQFLLSLSEGLDESQIPSLMLAMGVRARSRLSMGRGPAGAAVDLVLLVHRNRNRDPAWIEVDPSQIDVELLAYSASMSEICRRRRLERTRRLIEATPIERGFIRGLYSDGEAADARRELARLRRAGLLWGVRARELNTRYARQLGFMLDEQSARKLDSQVNSAAFPPVYPDPFDPFDFLQRADVDVEEVEAFRDQYATTNRAMSALFAKWEEHVLVHGYTAEDADEYTRKMREHRDARLAIAEAVVSTAAQISGDMTLSQAYQDDVASSDACVRRLADGWPLKPRSYRERAPTRILREGDGAPGPP